MAGLDQSKNVPQLDGAAKSDKSGSSALSKEFVTSTAPKIKESTDVKTSADAATNSAAHVYRIGDGMPPAKPDQGVFNLQTELLKLKYPVGKIDGRFGLGTKNAFSLFQKYNGLPQTGEADEPTQAKLVDPKAKADPEPPPRHKSTAQACVIKYWSSDNDFYCIHNGEQLNVTIPGGYAPPPSYNNDNGLAPFIYNRGTGRLEQPLQ